MQCSSLLLKWFHFLSEGDCNFHVLQMSLWNSLYTLATWAVSPWGSNPIFLASIIIPWLNPGSYGCYIYMTCLSLYTCFTLPLYLYHLATVASEESRVVATKEIVSHISGPTIIPWLTRVKTLSYVATSTVPLNLLGPNISSTWDHFCQRGRLKPSNVLQYVI